MDVVLYDCYQKCSVVGICLCNGMLPRIDEKIKLEGSLFTFRVVEIIHDYSSKNQRLRYMLRRYKILSARCF